MTDRPPFTHRLRVAHLNPHKPTPVMLEPDADTRAAIAAELGLLALPAMRFQAEISVGGNSAWVIAGRLTAEVVQPCVVTLEPVTTHIDESLRRIFSPHAATPEAEETEMPDDEIEPLGQFIDPAEIAIEALALALPLYPRAEGAELPAESHPEQDGDATRRPFAGLDRLLGGKKE